jgi:uncharacterized BrkB/YihY/UPF0761 family membrane protein
MTLITTPPDPPPRPSAGNEPPRRARPRHSRRWLRRLLWVAGLAGVLLALADSSAWAETTQVVALAPSIDAVLTNIQTWIMGILAALATLFLTIGGVRYLWASGDPSGIAKAKEAFKSAALGYALAALAPMIVTILRNLVGGP